MIHPITDLERAQAAEIERLLGGMKRYEEMAAMASAEIADLTAEIERLRAALRAQLSAFDGETIDEIEEAYGLGTAQRIDAGRAAMKGTS